jgi:hypothetical protein
MTPGERAQAGPAAASALKPDHIGPSRPLEPGSPENWEARQARIDAWWAEREQQYRNRPEIQEAAEQIRAETQRQRDEEDAQLQRLEARAAAGIPRAERALMEAYTWQAVETDPPEPSAKDDPGEWRAFFQHEYGRDMPLNAEYEAQKYRVEAASPPDVGGMAAAYFEANDPCGFDPAELAAERQGVSVEELYADRYANEPEAE